MAKFAEIPKESKELLEWEEQWPWDLSKSRASSSDQGG